MLVPQPLRENGAVTKAVKQITVKRLAVGSCLMVLMIGFLGSGLYGAQEVVVYTS